MLAPVVRGSDSFHTNDGAFKTGKRSGPDLIDQLSFRKSRRTNSVTLARTNAHITYNECLVATGEFANYVLNSYHHYLIGFRNYYDNGNVNERLAARSIVNAFLDAVGQQNGQIQAVRLDNRMGQNYGALSPAVGLKLPIANMCLAAQLKQMDVDNFPYDVNVVAKDLYLMGICKQTPTDQTENLRNAMYESPIYKTGHTECFAIWNTVSKYGSIEQPRIMQPVYFILKLVDLGADLVKSKNRIQYNAGTQSYELTYVVDVNGAKKKLTGYKHQYLWEIHPWFRTSKSYTDHPDIEKDCSTFVDGQGTVRGGYWCAGYVWQKCFLPLKMQGLCDFAHNVQHIETGNVCLLRAGVKNGIFMS
jgi:hypothetical protein